MDFGVYTLPYSQANPNGYMSSVEIPQVSLSLDGHDGHHGHHQLLPSMASMGCRGGGFTAEGV